MRCIVPEYITAPFLSPSFPYAAGKMDGIEWANSISIHLPNQRRVYHLRTASPEGCESESFSHATGLHLDEIIMDHLFTLSTFEPVPPWLLKLQGLFDRTYMHLRLGTTSPIVIRVAPMLYGIRSLPR